MWNHLLAAGLISLFTASAAPAADHTVEMLNADPASSERNIYSPGIIEVDVGDTVTWVATSKGHNVEFIKGAVPDGVEPFRSKLGKDVSYTFDTPGVYAYKCTPHYGLGMVGIVVVGDDLGNLEDVAGERYPGKSKQRMASLLDAIG